MVCLIVGLMVVAVDIITKIWATEVLKPIFKIPLWQGVFNLTYAENRGAAFGIFQDARVFFIIATVLILGLLFLNLRRFYWSSKLLKTGITFVSAGAVGNLIDRIFRGFVVDFFDFCLIGFPVFNVADIFVCVGAGLIVIFILFFDEKSGTKKDCKDDEV